MGQFERNFFAKHFKSISRLYALKKKLNKHNNDNGIDYEFNHHTMHWLPINHHVLLDEHNNRVKFIHITRKKWQ